MKNGLGIRKTLRALYRDEQGADMVEYILIVAAVALPLLGIILWFRDDLWTWAKGLWETAKGTAAQSP
jgi:Flp pilus assembly pilin Flp